MLQQLGKGSFGEVWIARLLEGPDESQIRYVAVKVELKSSTQNALMSEFQVMKTIGKHESLIEYIEFGEEFTTSEESTLKGKCYLALEYATNKTLLDYLMSKPGMVHEKWVRYWFLQIFKGLYYIRSQNHSHLDIKCENILLDEYLNAKIADFGFAQTHYPISKNLGSEFHRAPEICRAQYPYDGEKADVFALAIVLFAMQMKKFPTERTYNVTDSGKFKSFTQGQWQNFWPAAPQVSNEFKDLFQGMFREHHSQRAALKQIGELREDGTWEFKHPWLLGPLPTDDEIAQEIVRLNTIQAGTILYWTQ